MGKPWVGDALVNLFKDLWSLNKKLHGENTQADKYAHIIHTIWQRCNVCVVLKGGQKQFPRLVETDEDAYGNPEFYYSIPMGMSTKKVKDSVLTLSSFFKTDVLFKHTDNHPHAHFRLTIPMGKIYDRVDLTGLDEFLRGLEEQECQTNTSTTNSTPPSQSKTSLPKSKGVRRTVKYLYR